MPELSPNGSSNKSPHEGKTCIASASRTICVV